MDWHLIILGFLLVDRLVHHCKSVYEGWTFIVNAWNKIQTDGILNALHITKKHKKEIKTPIKQPLNNSLNNLMNTPERIHQKIISKIKNRDYSKISQPLVNSEPDQLSAMEDYYQWLTNRLTK